MKLSSLQKGLVGHWTMAQDSLKGSLLADKTPYENDGTIYGATFTTDRKGQANKAMSFDGVDDYIEILHNSNLSLSDNFSFGLWVKLITLPSGATTFLIKGSSNPAVDNYLIYLNTNGIVDGYVGKEDNSGNYKRSIGNINNGNWHYVLFTFHSVGGFKGYLDGVQVDTTLSTGTKAATNSNSVYLAYKWGTIYPNILLDDVRIYNRALSQAEITTLYNSYNSKIQL